MFSGSDQYTKTTTIVVVLFISIALLCTYFFLRSPQRLSDSGGSVSAPVVDPVASTIPIQQAIALAKSINATEGSNLASSTAQLQLLKLAQQNKQAIEGYLSEQVRLNKTDDTLLTVFKFYIAANMDVVGYADNGEQASTTTNFITFLEQNNIQSDKDLQYTFSVSINKLASLDTGVVRYAIIFTNLLISGAYNEYSYPYVYSFKNGVVTKSLTRIIDFDQKTNRPIKHITDSVGVENEVINAWFDTKQGDMKVLGMKPFSTYPCNHMATYEYVLDASNLEKSYAVLKSIHMPLVCDGKDLSSPDVVEKLPDTVDFEEEKMLYSTPKEVFAKVISQPELYVR